jgi:two-component system response regulator YesN
MTLRAYLREVRMREAKSWLLRTAASVSEVAVALGYEDTANFTHDFKRYVGLSPIEFRLRYSP